MRRVLGGLGADLGKDDRNERLAKLADIDWSKSNPEPRNVCIVASSVVSDRQARAATETVKLVAASALGQAPARPETRQART